MLANLFYELQHIGHWISSPLTWLALAFQLWMLVDAIRRQEWIWAIFIFFFSVISAVLYFFLVYRQSASLATRGFELPGAYDRRRIKELQAQIHHLDKAHHHAQLGDIYFQQGKLGKAEACYRAALDRDSQDIDTRAHLGQCLLRQNRPEEAKTLLEGVCRENPRHDYGHSMMAWAESLGALGETDQAIAIWQQVNENHSYARARVQLAELLVARHDVQGARSLLEEVLSEDQHAPAFERKRDRVWVRRARHLLGQVWRGG